MTDIKVPSNLAKTLGELRSSGWKSQSVKEEIRVNTVARIKSDQELFAGVLGYEETVMPQPVSYTHLTLPTNREV